jgi:hypothetical protein
LARRRNPKSAVVASARGPRAGCSSPPPKPTAATGKAAGGPRAQRIGAAEHRRLWVGARTRALRELTHRVCSNETNAVSGVSYAVRPKAEERREPAAQRRASLCAAPAARPSRCKLGRWSKRIADARQPPQPVEMGRPDCAFHLGFTSRRRPRPPSASTRRCSPWRFSRRPRSTSAARRHASRRARSPRRPASLQLRST